MIPLRQLISAEALRRYDEDGEPVYTFAERLLLALRWFDWATRDRILEAIDEEGAGWFQRERYTKAMQMLVKTGRVERRGEHMHYEYRIAPKATVLAAVTRNAPNPKAPCIHCESRKRAPGRSRCQPCLDRNAELARLRRRKSA